MEDFWLIVISPNEYTDCSVIGSISYVEHISTAPFDCDLQLALAAQHHDLVAEKTARLRLRPAARWSFRYRFYRGCGKPFLHADSRTRSKHLQSSLCWIYRVRSSVRRSSHKLVSSVPALLREHSQ